jgi:mRNA-degrading endonuclease RelE of RelBE toxin-antitoxin system
MSPKTKETIEKEAKMLFALSGYEGFSMRVLSKQSGISMSSIYHFFSEKDSLLQSVFNKTNTGLGLKRAKLPKRKSASKMLEDRVIFQFENIEDVVFVLKYYIHFRNNFKKIPTGFIPDKAYLHIEEVLRAGVKSGEFKLINSIEEDSKVVTHSINGFLLEYYPNTPKGSELKKLSRSISEFILKSLTNKEVPMK